MNERLNELIRLFKQLNPEEVVDENYKVRGTSLKKLAETASGGYLRVRDWARKKVEEQKVAQPDQDLVEMKAFFDKCLSLFEERNAKYGKSWYVLTPHSTANLIEMKANRAKEMGDENAKSLDEAYDMANYAAMLFIQLNRKK